MTNISDLDAMNDALEICSGLGLEMVPGFATHWPMAVEAMIRLGHADQVHSWADAYQAKRKHLDMPARVDPIDGDDEISWKAALGQRHRASDWRDHFLRQVRERPWPELVRLWWPRLMAGMSAGLTHGLIRTAHAMRSLDLVDAEPTQLQLDELASGLAYWAALHVEQPGGHRLMGKRNFPAIIAAIPRLAPDLKAGIIARGQYQEAIPGWDTAIAELEQPVDLDAAISDMTAAFVQVNLAHDKGFPVPLIHTFTAPAALRMSLRHLPEEYHLASFVAVWEAVAAVLANFAQPKAEETQRTLAERDEEVPGEVELAARAVDNGDEHAIKFAEACIRENRIRPDERYLLAAARMVPRLPRYFR